MPRQLALARSQRGKPAALAASRPRSLSSQTETRAPPASRERAAASPEIPIPKTAAVFPPNVRASIMLPQLERGKPEQGENDGDDPKAHHHCWLGPALLLKMMMKR